MCVCSLFLFFIYFSILKTLLLLLKHCLDAVLLEVSSLAAFSFYFCESLFASQKHQLHSCNTDLV